MNKDKIYTSALIYQNKIAKADLNLADTRYFRDTFKPIVELAVEIEKDRQEIVKKDLSDEEKIKEINTLFLEETKLEKLPADLLERLERADIKLNASDLTILESVM